MAERFDTPEDVRSRLKQITTEFSEERLAGWPDQPDFAIRRIQVFCELMYAELIMRTNDAIAEETAEAIRMREQEAIGKEEPPYTPPSDAPKVYDRDNTPPRNFVGELQAKATRRR